MMQYHTCDYPIWVEIGDQAETARMFDAGHIDDGAPLAPVDHCPGCGALLALADLSEAPHG